MKNKLYELVNKMQEIDNATNKLDKLKKEMEEAQISWDIAYEVVDAYKVQDTCLDNLHNIGTDKWSAIFKKLIKSNCKTEVERYKEEYKNFHRNIENTTNYIEAEKSYQNAFSTYIKYASIYEAYLDYKFGISEHLRSINTLSNTAKITYLKAKEAYEKETQKGINKLLTKIK